MDYDKDVDVNRKETKNEPSRVGVAVIKYGAYLIIFFALLWFIINYVFPMF